MNTAQTNANRPYPTQYVSPWTMRDGIVVTIRPIRPDDEACMVKFHETLSENSVYLRYFHLISLGQRTAHQRLTHVCFNDYDREIALVAEHHDAGTGLTEILAIGRLIKIPDTDTAEFALLVGDRFQRQGLGTELLRRLIQIGRAEHMRHIVGNVLINNPGMLHVCETLGFRRECAPREDVVTVTLDL